MEKDTESWESNQLQFRVQHSRVQTALTNFFYFYDTGAFHPNTCFAFPKCSWPCTPTTRDTLTLFLRTFSLIYEIATFIPKSNSISSQKVGASGVAISSCCQMKMPQVEWYIHRTYLLLTVLNDYWSTIKAPAGSVLGRPDLWMQGGVQTVAPFSGS